jgi:hypothetical protein
MARLTITISDDRHRALKETAARRGLTIGALIEESLDRAGVKTAETALAILDAARGHSAKIRPVLSEEEAMELAVEVTRDARRELAQERRRGPATSHR